MSKTGFQLFSTLLAYLSMAWAVQAATLYVSPAGSHTPPYTTWATAATNIQAAVGAAVSNDTVLVTNGTYTVGLVVADIRLESVNGPAVTIARKTSYGRCFWLQGSAVLSGFTVKDGDATGTNGGGVYCDDSTQIVTNCIMSGNTATFGGGIYQGTAINCVFDDNHAVSYGGGVYFGTANNCLFINNSAGTRGGGMSDGTANNCTIIDNTAGFGGGMYSGAANNSIVWYNSASSAGHNLNGTAASYTCSPDVTHGVDGNITTAPGLIDQAGGNYHLAIGSPCINTGSNTNVVGSADLDGAARVVDATVDMGAYEYDENTYDSDSDGLTDSEEVANGLDPLASNIGVDSDGDGLLDVDEVANGYDPLVSDFTPEHYVSLSGLHIFPYTNWTTAATNIQSAVAVAASNDTVWVANGTYLLASEITVAKDITIQSMNGPGAAIVDGNGVVRCFNLGTNACTVSGFTITNGLATTETIPANIGGGIYCGNTMPVVSNCTISGNTASGYSNVDFDTGYGYGGGMYGGTAYDCTISGNTASGFGSGYGYGYGGGMYVGAAYNCIISGNTASGSSSDGSGSGYGGGMYGGAAYNCIISGNTASGYSGSGSGSGVGGGIVWFSGGEAYNCTISGNTASGSSSSLAGGIGGGTNYNCIIWYNNASVGADAVQSTFYFGCSPDATNGMNGNITDSPFFADKDNGDYRLLYGSACINAGSNVYAAGISTDLDGGMRIVDATVDMGAYEYDATTYDSDDDTRLDADEVLMGLDPNYNENAAIAYGEAQVANNPESYGLYTASAVLDLGVGDIGVMVTNGNAELWLQMWQSEDLVAWTNAGPPVLWLFPVGPSNSFYRVRADP